MINESKLEGCDPELPPVPFLVRLRRTDYLGVTCTSAPALASSNIHSEPSGPSATSRMRLPTAHRSAVLAPPLPSRITRVSDCVPMPPMKPLPSHCGKVWVPR